jgi:type II secretory pathway component GspD/PulD (secretin)
LISPLEAERLYRSNVDSDGNLLIVTATPEIHQRVSELRTQMDTAALQPQSRMRFYQLQNATVEEILTTIQALTGQSPLPGFPGPYSQGRGGDGMYPGPNYPPPGVGQPLPAPPFYRETPPAQNTPRIQPMSLRSELMQQPGTTQPQPGIGQQLPGGTSGQPLLPFGQAQIIADPSTNSLIVVGDPEAQRQFEELIRRLDRRKPQVLIEAKVVIIDTSDDYALGVEVSFGDRLGARRLFNFSSYGLSTVDPVSGSLALIPGLGYNGTLVDPDNADAIIRALATHDRARITSAPRIVVNDHATGTLDSVTEEPFTSINASQTVATTSFGGFVDAGTQIEVTPHISEGNHIQLEFTVTLNSFTGPPGEGTPPPRQTDEVKSQVTIPDGYTVIVGGLNRTSYSKSIEGIPLVEHIPILKFLSSRRTTGKSTTSVFVFLRSVVLREDKFERLKFYSDRDLSRAWLPGNFPSSKPITLK